MDGRVARRAAAAGVAIAINSDCHRAEALGRQMSFGVGTARRGWLGPEQVLNTRGIEGVRQFIARKRGRSAR
jgi:DNA polymerase (family X)